MATTTKVPEKLTPLAKAMLVPILTEAEIKDALGEDEVKNGLFVFYKNYMRNAARLGSI